MATLTQINFTQIYCVSTSESGKDEVYFKIIIDNLVAGQFPTDGSYHSLGSEGTWTFDVTYAYTEFLTISLWDDDGTSGDDPLGSFTFTAGQAYSSPVTVSNPNGAEYKISFALKSC